MAAAAQRATAAPPPADLDQVSPERLARLQQVARDRCYDVIPVLEALHDVGNMSAVCRSADALGLGAMHCVVNGTRYKHSQRTTAGSEKWLDVKVWTSTADCLRGLKKAGYQVVTTYLNAKSIPIQEVDWTRPTAFVVGNEREGVTQAAIDLSDAVVSIPMTGFVESFNVSVAAALIMWEAQQQRTRRLGRQGDLGEREREALLAEYLIRGVDAPI
ncbi:tRNA guanosine-2'-O-methyltransferase [Monoraphidium neglectum]|uniref:tRNA guanosine-2'-O-methyltransferase n=1 Tax=Monoraphidium neglectum TaxID=145388 RepID=A0A0D2N778_9CHLO|nr:tRNA guanosine-2'-O-methyltransferase [Monoraphidium neglectum]KIZ01691.1 tRNA guanosine-2'-O-methyltransferase [Monoraphidium neglectum]|eukprot:XP_013900710.1 tRNA guanosine-2'-O-methyltransferase [Monoraphidium neglectum]